MSDKNPVLFRAHEWFPPEHQGPVVSLSTEITLRDLFAMAAASGLAQRVFVGVGYGTAEQHATEALAVAAYRLADALIAERAKARP